MILFSTGQTLSTEARNITGNEKSSTTGWARGDKTGPKLEIGIDTARECHLRSLYSYYTRERTSIYTLLQVNPLVSFLNDASPLRVAGAHHLGDCLDASIGQ